MWRALKAFPIVGTHFRRQAPIGPYIVDFLCPALHLVIEIDGGHHAENNTARHDQIRQEWLEAEGYRVLRFWNSDVATNMAGVLQTIATEVEKYRNSGADHLKHQRVRKPRTSPHPARSAVDPSPPGEGEA